MGAEGGGRWDRDGRDPAGGGRQHADAGPQAVWGATAITESQGEVDECRGRIFLQYRVECEM